MSVGGEDMNKKRLISLLLVSALTITSVCGCTSTKEKTTKKDNTAKTKAETTVGLDPAKDSSWPRSFSINEGSKESDNGTYIEQLKINGRRLYLKGKFGVIDAMDGQVSTREEADIEISKSCSFYDQRLDGDGSMTFKEFKEHIADSGYTAPDNYMITIDRGKVYLIQLFD